ncbi:MAG: type II 3-dehydroquinate dehydratase [Bacilli bacterium]
MHILVINGPNLQRLGKREPEVYGRTTLAELEARLVQFGETVGIKVTCKQSNHEGDLIDWIGDAEEQFDGIVLNPGAFTHYSYAIRDAIASITCPVIEVHISNVHARESFRHTSVVAPVSRGQIVGFGLKGYFMAIQSFTMDE